MANKTLADLKADIRVELEDPVIGETDDGAIWSGADLEQAVEDTVSMLSRLKPKGNIQDKVVPSSPTAETLTISGGTGTLAVAPAKPKSESIKNSEGTVLTKDTNYSINYITGVVTAITGMDDGEYTVSYTIHPYFIKVTNLSDVIKIQSVEYPAGQAPPTFPGFDLIEDWLILKLGATDQLSSGNHIHIHTLEEWTQPTADTGGDYPPHLDQAVITGSVGNALLNKSRKYRWLAAAALADCNTAIGNIAVDVSVDIDSVVNIAAPTDVTTTIELTTTDFDAIIAKIDADATGLKLAEDYLAAGDDLINAVNIGKEVAAMYAQYAAKEIDKNVAYLAQAGKLLELEVSKAQAAVETVKTKIAHEEHKINVGRAQVEAVNAQIADANTEIATAQATAAAYVQQAEKYLAEAVQYNELADKMAMEGKEQISSFVNQVASKWEGVTSLSAQSGKV